MVKSAVIWFVLEDIFLEMGAVNEGTKVNRSQLGIEYAHLSVETIHPSDDGIKVASQIK